MPESIVPLLPAGEGVGRHRKNAAGRDDQSVYATWSGQSQPLRDQSAVREAENIGLLHLQYVE